MKRLLLLCLLVAGCSKRDIPPAQIAEVIGTNVYTHADPPPGFVILSNGKEWKWKIEKNSWKSITTYGTKEEAIAGAWKLRADLLDSDAHPYTNVIPAKQ